MTELPFHPQLLTQVDVQEFWRVLINPLGWHTSRVYLALVDQDHRPLPHIVEIDEVPPILGQEQAETFGAFLRRTIQEMVPAGSVALLLCRPGPPPVTARDRVAAASYYAALRTHGVPCEVIHLGTDLDILPLPADETDAMSA